RPIAACTGHNPSLAIAGTNFHTTSGTLPSLVIGGQALRNVVVLSTTAITADLPEGGLTPGGARDGTITVAEGCTAPLSEGFTHDAPPTGTAIAADTACAGSGMQVTVSGTGFHTTGSTSPTVTIQGVALAAVTVDSATSLRATLPSSGLSPGGPYDV